MKSKTQFRLIERGLPTKNSRAIYDKFSEEILNSYKEPEGWRGYCEGHGERLCFDLDYADKFFKPDDRLLEIGSLPYFLTVPLMEKYNVFALDQKRDKQLAPEITDKYGINSLLCDIENMAIPAIDEDFDGIIMNEVFEHLRIDLIFTMREVFRVLRPGGTLLLSTPNLRSLMGIYNLLFRGESWSICRGLYEQYSWLEKFNTMGHTREYTFVEVATFLKEIGFEIHGVIYRGRYRGFGHPITKILPTFKPYFSIVAGKPLTAENSVSQFNS